MAFKSEAQRQKFLEMVKEGKMSQETYDAWSLRTPKDIPDRLYEKEKIIRRVKVIK